MTGTPDLHNATVASGCVTSLRPHLSLGTSAWISCPVPAKKSDVIRQMASIPGLGDGQYLLANNQDSAGRALEWFRAAVAPESSYAEIEALAATSPPGANRVLFTPWLTGERSPIDDRRARGGFHNVSLDSTRADLARAVLEGVALNLRWLLGGAEKFAGTRFDPIRVLGGGARMDLWCQVLADVCDRTLERVAEPLVGGLRGCGLYVGLALGDVTADRLARPGPGRPGLHAGPGDPGDLRRAVPGVPRPARAQQADVRPPQRLRSPSSQAATWDVTAGSERRRLWSPGSTTTSRPAASGGRP